MLPTLTLFSLSAANIGQHMLELVRLSAQSSPPPASFQPKRRDPVLRSDVGIEASPVPSWKTTRPFFASSPMESLFPAAVPPILGAFSSPNFYLTSFHHLEVGLQWRIERRPQAGKRDGNLRVGVVQYLRTILHSVTCQVFAPLMTGTPATVQEIPKSQRGPCVSSPELLSMGSHNGEVPAHRALLFR